MLRKIHPSDIEIFFTHQTDLNANHMAAFTRGEPENFDKFKAHWERVLANQEVVANTIIFEDEVAGYIVLFDIESKPHVGYWIGREYWGKGVATLALTLFLKNLKISEVFARVAIDNLGSRKVLEKAGFKQIGRDKTYAAARKGELEELIYSVCLLRRDI